MKKALLNLFVLFIFSTVSYSQAVVINSPASLAGAYVFGTASFGATLTTQIWCGDAVLMKDASANPTLACDPTVLNAAAIKGKFVLIDRGNCEFGAKALLGEQAGAIACIIFNNVANAGVQAMGAGAVGANVTIPCVMLSFEDGVKIKAALAANQTVNFCIGNIKFSNDVATNNRAGICHAPFGTYPVSWLRNPGDFVINPGASITNKGQNMGVGVKLNGKISFTPNGGSSSQFYDKTSDPGIFVEVDSTNTILLESKDILGFADKQGKGTISYNITSDSIDKSPADNAAISEFYLSNNIFSKGRLAANGQDPFVTASYRRSDGTNAEFISGYTIPYCKGCKIDSIKFNMAISAPSTLSGLTAQASVYGWVDANGDGDASNDELSFLATGSYTYPMGDTRTSAIASVPLEDFGFGTPGLEITDDNFGVFIGVSYGGVESTFFGFDEGIDYTCDNQIHTNAANLRIDNLPYLGITGYDPNSGVPDIDNASFRFTGLSAPLAASMILSGQQFGNGVSNKQLSDLEATVKLFPNPAKDKFSVNVALNESSSKVVYDVMDNSGKIIFQYVDKKIGKEFNAIFNVQNLDNGLYHILVKTDKGFKQVSFEVLK